MPRAFARGIHSPDVSRPYAIPLLSLMVGVSVYFQLHSIFPCPDFHQAGRTDLPPKYCQLFVSVIERGIYLRIDRCFIKILNLLTLVVLPWRCWLDAQV